MNNKEKEQYLRKAISIKIDDKVSINIFNKEEIIAHYQNFPERLYKYRTVTDFNLDALENSYIFLSPADKMDDQFECTTNIDIESIYDSNNETLTSTFVEELVDMIDYPSTLNKEEMLKLAYSYVNGKKTYDDNVLQKISEENPDLENPDIAKEVADHFIQIATSIWKSESLQKSLKDLFLGAISAKHEQGIGSLAESNKSQVMWEMYANHYRGYCVEYDFRKSANCLINTFPVIYGDKRKTELVRILVALSIEAIVYQMSRKNIKVFDKTLDYIRLFVTKYEEWSFQNEWRILGEKKLKFNVPKPLAIYMGKKCSKKDKRKLFEIAKKKNIKLYQQKDNMTSLSLEFERIL